MYHYYYYSSSIVKSHSVRSTDRYTVFLRVWKYFVRGEKINIIIEYIIIYKYIIIEKDFDFPIWAQSIYLGKISTFKIRFCIDSNTLRHDNMSKVFIRCLRFI